MNPIHFAAGTVRMTDPERRSPDMLREAGFAVLENQDLLDLLPDGVTIRLDPENLQDSQVRIPIQPLAAERNNTFTGFVKNTKSVSNDSVGSFFANVRSYVESLRCHTDMVQYIDLSGGDSGTLVAKLDLTLNSLNGVKDRLQALAEKKVGFKVCLKAAEPENGRLSSYHVITATVPLEGGRTLTRTYTQNDSESHEFFFVNAVNDLEQLADLPPEIRAYI
jgi:hypothetical protein